MGKNMCLGEEKRLGRGIFVVIKRRSFYIERERLVERMEKRNGLGSANGGILRLK